MIRPLHHLVLAAILLLGAGFAFGQTEIVLGRFFGDCEQAGTDIDAAVGEACIIQSIINAFSEADNGTTVETLPTDWGNYYDQIKARYAGGNAPDVHVMHRHRVPEFAGLGVLADLTDDLAAAGIDVGDWAPAAVDAVSFNGRIYGVPLDFHANLWHVNMELMAEAGLVNSDGTPMLPSSPEELLAHARQFEEATGKDYLAADFTQFPIGVRLVLTFLWQQDSNIFEGDEATVDSPEAQRAVETIVSLFDAGYADSSLNYADSQQKFLDGDVGVLVNGTWVVDFYDAQAADPAVALTDYYVADFPTLFAEPATWADTHMWAIPASLKRDDPAKYEAALQLLAWINDHSVDWARTGHLSPRLSVLESAEYQNLPHRDEYANTANIARDNPPAEKYGAIQDVLDRELQAVWLTGKPIADALSDANDEIEDLLR